MFAMLAQLLEALLHPLPILLVLLLGECAYLWVLLRIALEDAWADQVSGIAQESLTMRDMANLQNVNGGRHPGRASPPANGNSGTSCIHHRAAMVVRRRDAKRTGSGQRGKPRRSLQDRGLPGHVADNVGRHFGCGAGGRSRRVAGRIFGRQHVHGRQQGIALDRPL